jgi:hypothetical protein
MSIRNCKHLVVLALMGWGSYFAMQQPLVAGGQIVPVSNPVVDDCYADRCAGHSFCYKLRLHGIYARRCMTQKYVLLPTNPAIAPYLCPPQNAGLPYGSPYGQPTIGGYGSPPQIPAPAGVFIR